MADLANVAFGALALIGGVVLYKVWKGDSVEGAAKDLKGEAKGAAHDLKGQAKGAYKDAKHNL